MESMMCNFISWIKKNKQLLYLTDEDIFSEYGKEVLKDYSGNDFLGHEAIRRYYDRNKKYLKSGTEYTVKDFWNTDKLPSELAEKINNFDKYWSKTFTKYFTNDDLCNIIINASSGWREKAWIQLQNREQIRDSLYYIIRRATNPYKRKVCEQLLKQSPTNIDLCNIICYGIEPYRKEAWKQLLEQDPTTRELCNLMIFGNKTYREKAWRRFNKR